MVKLLLQPTDTSQWHALVNEAQEALAVTLAESVESYLVFMLMRYTELPQCVSDTMGEEYLISAQCEGNEREVKLRDVGDKCLLFTGLFPGLAKRRHVKLSYFINIGRSAYHSLAHMNQETNDLYARLSADFIAVMDVMQTIRGEQNNLILKDTVELAQVYESRVAARLYADLTPAQIRKILNSN